MDWKNEMFQVYLLWKIDECNEKIPVFVDGKYECIENDIMSMQSHGLIEYNKENTHYKVSKKGTEALQRLIAMYDQVEKFEIFRSIKLDGEMPVDILDEEGNVMDHCHDPRFNSLDAQAEDLRLAMMTWAVEAAKQEGHELEINCHKIVFTQMLASHMIENYTLEEVKNGKVFNKIDSLVKNAYKWEDLGNDNDESWGLANEIYTLGMLEQRKLSGCHCSKCGIPLALFEANAEADEVALLDCPNPDCGADFREPSARGLGEAEFECPACKADIYKGQTHCKCGARVDFSLPAGTVTETTLEETVVEEEVYYDDCYYYTPYGYYDPWYPSYNAFAFGFLCGAIIL